MRHVDIRCDSCEVIVEDSKDVAILSTAGSHEKHFCNLHCLQLWLDKQPHYRVHGVARNNGQVAREWIAAGEIYLDEEEAERYARGLTARAKMRDFSQDPLGMWQSRSERAAKVEYKCRTIENQRLFEVRDSKQRSDE